MPIKGDIRAASEGAAAGSSRRTGTLHLEGKKSAGDPAAESTAVAKLRAAFYVDGFNLYHAVDLFNKQHLKWFDLRRVCEHVLIDKGSERIEKIVWCSAEPKDTGKLVRHQAFQKALRSRDVQIELGHFVDLPKTCEGCRARINQPCRQCGTQVCSGCGRNYSIPNEKEGDVNVALHAVVDAMKNVYDVCYLLTADSDQVPTMKFVKGLGKRVVLVSPPVRDPSFHLLELADAEVNLTEVHFANSLFGATVLRGGSHVVTRPAAYAPPAVSIRGRQGSSVSVVRNPPRKR